MDCDDADCTEMGEQVGTVESDASLSQAFLGLVQSWGVAVASVGVG